MPMIKLLPLYGNIGRMDLAAEVIKYLETKKSNFTEWEKLRFGTQTARYNCDYAKAADFSRRRFEMDPSDITASNNAADNYLRINNPRQALSELNDFGLRLRDMNITASSRELWIAMSHYILGEYDKAIKVIDTYPFKNINGSYAHLYIEAVIRQGDLGKIDLVKEDFLNRDCFSRNGEKIREAELLLSICNSLVSVGQDSLAKIYASQLENWTISNKNDPDYLSFITLAYYFQGKFNEAIRASQLFESPWLNALRGVCYAKMMDRENAEKELEIINSQEEQEYFSSIRNNYSTGRKNYLMAYILTALGDSDKAIDLLIQTPESCFPFHTDRYQFDHHFASLYDDPRFISLVKPKMQLDLISKSS